MSVRSVPTLNFRNVITQFAGIRAVLKEKHDFLIEESKTVPGFIQLAGICSPGLSSSPVFGVEVLALLENAGLEAAKKADFNPIRRRPKSYREMDEDERRQAINRDEKYGRIICRCETVTEAEVVSAIPFAGARGDYRRYKAQDARRNGTLPGRLLHAARNGDIVT